MLEALEARSAPTAPLLEFEPSAPTEPSIRSTPRFPRPTDEAAPGDRLVVQLSRERPGFYTFLPELGCRADSARFNKDIADLLESCDNLAGCAA